MLQNGFELPVYGLGLWGMGGTKEADPTNDEKDIAAIKASIKAGITHIDTAESYGAGHAEELLGKVLVDHDRSKLIIATKVSAHNQGYDGVMHAFEASLKRIGTNYIDLYLLHRYPMPGISIADTMRAMDELVAQGVVKNIGVCNLTPGRFDEVQRHTKNKLVCNQVHYNVQYREIEAWGVLKYAQEHDVMVVAWRPVQKGLLPDTQLIKGIAEKYRKTPTQIAVNWLVSQRNVVTIAKTSSPEHLQENLGALDFVMEHEDIERIRHEFPNQQNVSDAVPLTYDADIDP